MSQISPPMRIVLGVAVAFLALYMVALRPKSAATPPAPAPAAPAGNVNTGKPAVTSLGKAVEKAKGAVAATAAGQVAEGKAAGLTPPSSTSTSGSTATGAGAATATAPTATTPAKPAAPAIDTSGLPKPVARALQQHKVLVLLFTNRNSADDLAVDRALRAVHRFDPRVFTRAVPLATISKYGRITRGADVQQSPTVVVIDRKQKATTLVGYVDAVTIEQTVVDAMRASGGLFPGNRYFEHVNQSCASVSHTLNGTPQAMTLGQAPLMMRRFSTRIDAFVADVRSTPAPARYRGFKRAFLSGAVGMQRSVHTATRRLGAHPTLAAALAAVTGLVRDLGPGAHKVGRLADRHQLVFCGRLG